MTEPENTSINNTRKTWKLFLYCGLIFAVIVGAFLGVTFIISHNQQLKNKYNNWRNAYGDLLSNPENPDRALSAFLKNQLLQYYKERKRYPSNAESLAFIDTTLWNATQPQPEFPDPNQTPQQQFNAREQQRQAIAQQTRRLIIHGPIAFLIPVNATEDQKSFKPNGFDLAYCYVNKRELSGELLSDMKYYEILEQAALNRIDDGIFIYATDWVNAYRYNLDMQTIALHIKLWTWLIYSMPLVALVLITLLSRKAIQAVKNNPGQENKRQFIVASMLAGVGVIIASFLPWSRETTMCYIGLPMPPTEPLGMFRQALEGKDYRKVKLGDLLNKFQERGIIQKDTADKIRQARNIQ